MKDKLIVVWFLSLLCIPLLSFYGRPLQLYLINHFSMETLGLCLSVMLSGIVLVFLIALFKSGLDHSAYHLIWVGGLSILLYTHLPFVEKIHVALFGLFGFLSQRIFEQKMAALLGVAIAGLDELLQYFLVVRVGDWRDVWLNLFSAALGMLLAFLLFDSNRGRAAKASAQ